MRRKLLSFFLAALLVILPVTAAAAAGTTPQLLIETSVSGNTMTVTLSISGNPGVNTLQGTLGFDASAVKCTAMGAGDVLSNMMYATNPNGDSGAIFAGATTTTVTENGVIAVYKFQILDANADPGFYLSDVALGDADGNDQAYTVLLKDSSGSTSTPPVTGGGSSSGNQTGDNALPIFRDSVGHWAELYISLAAKNKLVYGYDTNYDRYGPDDTMRREDFISILWRHAGSPDSTYPIQYEDVAEGKYYTTAVRWARENSIMVGNSDYDFGVGDPVTREQMIAILHRMAGEETGGELMFTGIYDNTFTDSGKLTWAKQSVYWGIYNNIWCDADALEVGTTLNNSIPATRAQIAVMLIRYMINIEEVSV